MGFTTLTRPETNNPVDLFTLQQRSFPGLLAWSVGSVVSGLFWRWPRPGFWRGFGDQFIGWGLVDGLIASFGLRSAQRNFQRFQYGEMNAEDYARQSRNFTLIVALNVLVDVGYIIGGRSLINRAEREQQRGTGWGILVQGGFLLIWDIFLLMFKRGTSVGR